MVKDGGLLFVFKFCFVRSLVVCYNLPTFSTRLKSMSDEYLEPSKAQIKRQIKQIKELGLNLCALDIGQLKTIPLSDEVLPAVIELKNIKSNVAKKRQTQYLTKVLFKQDNLDDIYSAYQAILGQKQQVDASFHLAEKWREQFIADPSSTITEFMQQYSSVSSQELRHLVQKAAKERKLHVNHGAYRALFRFIKQVIDNG